MRILLPPSEGKAAGRRGRSLDLGTLSFPGLTEPRRKVLDTLAVVSGRPDALELLDAPSSAADVVRSQAAVFAQPTIAVSALYTGVLYDALGVTHLATDAKRRASRRLIVISALFGALRMTDRVPTYRLSMGVDLPGIGRLSSHWAPSLGQVLTAEVGRGLIVDMRSSTYVAAWRPKGTVADQTVAVHVVRDGDTGRTAVSHMAKHTRGLVARVLCEERADPRRPEQLVAILSPHFTVTLDDPVPGRPRRLEVVEPG